MRRNALASSVFALAFVAVFAGLSSALMASQREARALRAAATQSAANEQVSAFLVSLFEAAAPEENLGKPLSALEMLDIGWQRLQSTPLMSNAPNLPLTNLPGTATPNDASPLLALAMGESFYGLGEFKRARDAFEPRNLSWTDKSVLFFGVPARREEAACSLPATTNQRSWGVKKECNLVRSDLHPQGELRKG